MILVLVLVFFAVNILYRMLGIEPMRSIHFWNAGTCNLRPTVVASRPLPVRADWLWSYRRQRCVGNWKYIKDIMVTNFVKKVKTKKVAPLPFNCYSLLTATLPLVHCGCFTGQNNSVLDNSVIASQYRKCLWTFSSKTGNRTHVLVLK
jgi:hypothetical protein